MSRAVVRGPRWLTWIRALPRASVLVFCGIVVAAVQAVLGLLEVPTGVREGAAFLVVAVATAAELDKLHTRRQEQRDAEQQAQQAREAAEAEWLRQVQDSLRVWPAPRIDEVDPYVLGVTRSPLADRYTGRASIFLRNVSRDREAVAWERLRAQGLLLIVGALARGATRTTADTQHFSSGFS